MLICESPTVSSARFMLEEVENTLPRKWEDTNGSMHMDADRSVGRKQKLTGSLSQKLLILGILEKTLYTTVSESRLLSARLPRSVSSIHSVCPIWALSKLCAFPCAAISMSKERASIES